MIKLVAALQLESEVNQHIILRVLKGRPQHRSMKLGEKICLTSAAYYPFAAWNLTTYLDHTRSHYSHAAAPPFSPTVQARSTTSPNFINEEMQRKCSTRWVCLEKTPAATGATNTETLYCRGQEPDKQAGQVQWNLPYRTARLGTCHGKNEQGTFPTSSYSCSWILIV